MIPLPFRKKLSYRLTLIYSLILIFIALSISLFNINIYSDEVSKQMREVVIQKESLILGTLSQNIDEIRDIHANLLVDNNIKSAFTEAAETGSDSSIWMLTNLLNHHPSNSAEGSTIIAIGTDGTIYNTIENYPPYLALAEGNEDFNLLTDGQQYFRLSTPNTFPNEYNDPTMSQRINLTFYGQYFNYDEVELLGYIAINFRKQLIFEDIESLAKETFHHTYIVDEEGRLVHQIGDETFDSIKVMNYIDQLDSASITEFIDGNYTIRATDIPGYERWHLVTFFDNTIVSDQTDSINRYIYIILIIAFLIMVFISFITSQTITRPIRDMVHSMKRFEDGDWPEPLETDNEDEIKDLIIGYNTMLESIEKLTDDIVEKAQEKKRVEIDLIKTQIGLLEAQINPHFIHNTLNSMNYLAMKAGNDELSKAIESFNNLLRMSMATEISYITVAKEIQNIKDYCRIQNIRFENAFTTVYNIDDDVSIAKLPKLILQPFVENSIVHGILPMEKQGHIVITIRRANQYLLATIEDNGIGMDKERLQQLTDLSISPKSSRHIGIKNVLERLELLYGEEVTFNIRSIEGLGTTFEFMIPYED